MLDNFQYQGILPIQGMVGQEPAVVAAGCCILIFHSRLSFLSRSFAYLWGDDHNIVHLEDVKSQLIQKNFKQAPPVVDWLRPLIFMWF